MLEGKAANAMGSGEFAETGDFPKPSAPFKFQFFQRLPDKCILLLQV